MRNVLVVGGGAAGLAAAEAAKRSGSSNVILLEEGTGVGDRKSLLPYLLSGEVTEADIRLPDSRALADRIGIELRLGEQTSAVDPAAHVLRTTKGRYTFDALVLATGSAPEKKGGHQDTDSMAATMKKENVFTMRGYPDYRGLADALGSLTRVAVLGSSPISFIVSELISNRGLAVTLFEPSGASVGWLPPAVAALLGEEAARRGVELVEGAIQKVVGVSRTEAVISTDGRVHSCDAVVIFPRMLSTFPSVEGLTLGRYGGVLVDGHMKTSADSIYAAGDCAEVRWGNSSLSVRLRSSAEVMGTVAGVNAAGGDALAHISGAISQKIFGIEVCGAGIDSEQARAVGLDPVEVTTTTKTTSPRTEDGPLQGEAEGSVSCTMIVDRSTRAVCGVFVIGRRASSHAETLSLIASMGMQVSDVAYYETPYSQMDSSGPSPIALTARRAAALIGAPVFEPTKGTRL